VVQKPKGRSQGNQSKREGRGKESVGMNCM
jgi:hypothetical protein